MTRIGRQALRTMPAFSFKVPGTAFSVADVCKVVEYGAGGI